MSLQKAVQLARNNPIVPVGRNSISRFCAVIVDDSGSEYFAWNSYLTHPLQARFGSNDKSVHLHCEVACILEVIKKRAKQRGTHYRNITDLSDCRMSVARVIKDGSPAMAKPCVGCQRALIHYNISNIEWTV